MIIDITIFHNIKVQQAKKHKPIQAKTQKESGAMNGSIKAVIE